MSPNVLNFVSFAPAVGQLVDLYASDAQGAISEEGNVSAKGKDTVACMIDCCNERTTFPAIHHVERATLLVSSNIDQL